jgi:hypothetical protein
MQYKTRSSAYLVRRKIEVFFFGPGSFEKALLRGCGGVHFILTKAQSVKFCPGETATGARKTANFLDAAARNSRRDRL